MSKKITKTMVDKAEANLHGDVWIWDAEVEGFGVRIKPTGRKTYVVRYRSTDGTQRKMTLGRCSDMPPEKARELARKTFTQVAEGHDPAAARAPSAKDKAVTVRGMFEAYVAHMRSKGRVSVVEVERALLTAKQNAADALGANKHPASIEPKDIVKYLAVFYRAGHRGAADKHRGYIASAYTWAAKSANDYTAEHRQDWGLTTNPGALVPKDAGAIGARDRNLSALELRAVWAATAPDAPGFSAEIAVCIRMLIGCGQRVQETLRIDGSEINLQTMEWRMPAEKTKGRKFPHTIPLPDAVIDDLATLIAIHGDGPLFPARGAQGDERMDHRSVMQAIERLCARDGIQAFQSRDIRRTWKSRAHEAGVDRFTRDLIQQHAQNGNAGSKHYDRAEYGPQMSEAMAKWNAWLLSHVIASAEPEKLAA
jgi:integrase